MKLFFTLLFSVSISGYTQDAGLAWAKRAGGPSNETAIAITVDASGNVYSTGGFQGTTDFDPGPGVFNLTSAGINDVYISKVDAAGNFVWAVRMGSTSSEAGRSIAVDPLGNVYTTGWFQGTADFDPGAGTYNLAPVGGLDIFISKLNAAGEFVWAIGMGSAATGYDAGESIKTDALGNVYVISSFAGTVDFDPGPGTFNLTSAGSMDIVILKLNTSGGFLWANSMGGTGIDEGFDVTLDATGNVYSTGYFFGTVDFDPGAGIHNLTSAGSNDIFIQKLDASGNLVWARSMGGTSDDRGFSIAVDGSGNVYSTGFFTGTADFDPGAATENMTADGATLDGFVSKLNSSGAFVWIRSITGNHGEWPESLALDGSGVYITGRFGGTADFDPGPGVHNVTTAGSLDIFVTKLTTSGGFSWAKTFGSTGDDRSYGIAVDAMNHVHFTGDFSATVDFDPGPGSANLTSVGLSDIMVVKLNQTGILPIHLGTLTGIYKNDKVVLEWKSYDDDDAKSYEIWHSINGRDFIKVGQVQPRKLSQEIRYKFIHSGYRNGKNYYRVQANEFNGKVHQSNIVLIEVKGTGAITLLANPVFGQMTVQFNATGDEKITLHLYDGSGKRVGTTQKSLTTGINQVQWDINNVASGYYVLEVISGGKQETIKMMKL